VREYAVFVDCARMNPQCWTQTNDVSGAGGYFPNVASLYDCKAACIRDMSCVAVNWKPSNIGQHCEILATTDIWDVQPGTITHHQLYRSCLDSPGK